MRNNLRFVLAFSLTVLVACGEDPTVAELCGTASGDRQRWAGNGHFYHLVLQPGVTWSLATSQSAAESGNWYLATITSAQEWAFVEGMLRAGPPHFAAECATSNLVGRVCSGIWLGASTASASSQAWQWVTGEAFTFNDWGPLEPFRNGDRVRVDEFRDRASIAWNDVPSTAQASGYVMETETMCTA
jgi:hypothetical protein